jgi:hypothetical protein
MPTLLRHAECGSCGHRHHFCLPAGELTPGAEYEYVCPETGRRAALRPQEPGEASASSPQGAVGLEVPARRPSPH